MVCARVCVCGGGWVVVGGRTEGGCAGGLVREVGEVTQVGDTDRGGGTVQSPCLNLQTNPA